MNAAAGARHFHEDLAQLKNLLLEMSTLAEEQVRTSVEALRERDASKAESVVLADRELDAMEMEVDDACIQLLALQQPLARDLRLIMMAMKIAKPTRVFASRARTAAILAYRFFMPVFSLCGA